MSRPTIDPRKKITLEVTNAVALYLVDLVGRQSAADLAQAGVDGLYTGLSQLIVQANVPQPPAAATPAAPAPAASTEGGAHG